MVEKVNPITEYWGKRNNINKFKTHDESDITIANKINMPVSSFRKIKTGKMNVLLHHIVQIADALRCKTADLLPDEWQANNTISTDDFRLIADIFDIIDKLEQTKNIRLPNGLRSRIFIALFLQIKNFADNDNQAHSQEELVQYSSVILDGIINQ